MNFLKTVLPKVAKSRVFALFVGAVMAAGGQYLNDETVDAEAAAVAGCENMGCDCSPAEKPVVVVDAGVN